MTTPTCPICSLKQPSACATCIGHGNPDYYVECTHLCKHGGDSAKTGECSWRPRFTPAR